MALPWVGSLVKTTPACIGVVTVVISLGVLTGCNLSGDGDIKAVHHVVYMIQENRSFDHYFAKLNDYRMAQGLPEDVEALPAGVTNPSSPDSTPVASFHLLTMCIENTSPAWADSHADFNLQNLTSNTALMNGFAWTAGAAAVFEGGSDTAGMRAMGYYDQNDLPYYYYMATQFGVSDRWFSPGPMETEPSKMYMVAATSAGHVHRPANPVNVKTIFQELDEKGISWKIYYENQPSDAIINYFQPYAAQNSDKIVPISEYFTDVANGTLPSVAMIEPGFGSDDEHPGTGNHIQVGSEKTAEIINALMNSPSWGDSVFFLMYDESGGMYDHVPPPTNIPNPDGIMPLDLFTTAANGTEDPSGDFTRYGFRVPNLVISPFSKKNYVDHKVTDSTGVLKFIEKRFDLHALTKRDAAASDMTEFFDFQGKPWATPPTPPTQPTDGPCYDSLP